MSETTTEFQTEAERLEAGFADLQKNKFFFRWWVRQHEEFRAGYRGVSHQLNKAVAEAVSNRQELLNEIQVLKDTNEELERELDEANSAIGNLQTELMAVSERMDKMAEWAKKQSESKRT